MLPPRRKAKDGRKSNKPPKQYQFKKGESGNKKGRPKTTPTVMDFMEEELESKHSINVGAKQIQVPLKRLLVKQVFRLALKGREKALFFALEMLDRIQKANAKDHSAPLKPRPTSEEISKMSEDEMTKLYFEIINEGKSEQQDDD